MQLILATDLEQGEQRNNFKYGIEEEKNTGKFREDTRRTAVLHVPN